MGRRSSKQKNWLVRSLITSLMTSVITILLATAVWGWGKDKNNEEADPVQNEDNKLEIVLPDGEELEEMYVINQGKHQDILVRSSHKDQRDTFSIYRKDEAGTYAIQYRFSMDYENDQWDNLLVPGSMKVLGIVDIMGDFKREIVVAALQDGTAGGYDVAVLSCDDEGRYYLAGSYPASDSAELFTNRYDPEEGKFSAGSSTSWYTHGILYLMDETYLICVGRDVWENEEGKQRFVSIDKVVQDGSTNKMTWERVASEKVTVEDDFVLERFVIDLLLESGYVDREQYQAVYGGEKFVPEVELLEGFYE